MVLNIVAVLFILGITFMHSLFGVFSGLIDLFCAIVAMAVAFGFADALNEFVVEQGLHPSYALPACFVGLFVLTHLGLRLVADNYLRGNVRVPMYVDWAGGAACGFFVAMISVGVFALGFLMLPWGGRTMKFSRIERLPDLDREGYVEFRRNSIWFKPDEFTVGLFNLLSGGSLKHNTAFASVYPDFSEWVFWSGNTVQPESTTAPFSGERGSGFGQRGLKVLTWWQQPGPVEALYRAKLPEKDDIGREADFEDVEYEPDSGKHLLGVRLGLLRASADGTKGMHFHRFRPTMIRLVGTLRGAPRHYAARLLGGADPGEDRFRVVDLDNNFAIPVNESEMPLDAYFEVDDGFQPQFVEYRRFARAPLTGEPAKEGPEERLMGQESAAQQSQRTVGALRFIGAIIPEATGDLAELPIPLNLNALASAEVKEGKLESGRISGSVTRLRGAGPGSVREFAVPQGRRMFQVRCLARKAQSLAGKVFNFVGSIANQYLVTSNMGGRYPLAGYYAIVKRDGAEYMELYISGPDDSAFRSMLDFKFIRNAELRSSDAIIGLLFYVQPNENIIALENQTGQGVQFKVPGYRMGP